MAALEWVWNHRYLILLWVELEILFFSAIIFGWAALVVVLKQDNIFYDLCKPTSNGNSTLLAEYLLKDCIDERLDLVFLTGSLSFTSIGVISGPFLDHFGPRKTRLLSSFLFGLAFVCFILADKDTEDLIFPGMILLSSAGFILFMTVFQIANLFDERKYLVISSFSGGVDSSAVVLLICKLLYEAGVSLRSMIIFYFLLAIISSVTFTFILPPYTITSEAIAKLRNAKKSSVKPKIAHELSPLCESEVKNENEENDEDKDIDAESSQETAPRLMSQMLTPEYLLSALFMSVCNLRLWFYVGGLNSYFEFISGHNNDTVSKYTNWFGIMQCTGFFFAPITGLITDWKRKKEEKTGLSGFVTSYLLIASVALILNILVLLPSLSVQYLSFIVEVALRAFNYSIFPAFLVHKFSILHFGTLYGVGQLISTVLGVLQYGLFAIAESDLGGDPFWVNVAFLVLCFCLNIFPVFLCIKEKRQRR